MSKWYRAPVVSQRIIRLLGGALALCLIAGSAYGQTVLSLGSNPTRARGEGITEVTGLMTLTNGTNQAQVIPASTTITITYDGTITNNPAIATTAVGTAPNGNVYTSGFGSSQLAGSGVGTPVTIGQSGATLTITIPAGFTNIGTGSCAPGTPPATATTLCLVPGGSLNIQGVRLNLVGFAGNVYASVSSTACCFSASTVVTRAQATLGSVTPTAAALSQCSIPVTPDPADPNLVNFFTTGGLLGTGASTLGFTATHGTTIRPSEPVNFVTAFTSTGDEDFYTPSPGSPIGAGSTAVSTTPGFQGTAGGVTNGIHLIFTFSSVPAGIRLIVPAGFSSTTGSSTFNYRNTGVSAGVPDGQGVIVTPAGGAAVVTYALNSTTAASNTTVDANNFLFVFSAPSGPVVPTGSLGSVNVSVGPTSSVMTLSAVDPTVRFMLAQAGIYAGLGLTNPCLPGGSLSVTSGSGQSAGLGTTFGLPLKATVLDASSNPVPGVTVVFSAPAFGASATFTGSPTVVTDASGVATSPSLTANNVLGTYFVGASASGTGLSPVNFTLTNTAGPPASITKFAGDGQSAFPGATFGTALQVIVRDVGSNPVSGAAVTFTAPGFGPSGTFPSGLTAMATTNASGVATAPAFTANGTTGSFMVTASSGAAIPTDFNLTNVFGTPATLTLGSTPTKVRSEGITETVGMITLTNSTGTAQVIPPGFSIIINFDGTITNNPGVATTAVGLAPDRNIYTTGIGSSQQDGGGGISQYVGSGGCVFSPPSFGCTGLVATRSGSTLTIAVPSGFINTGSGVCDAGSFPANATTLCLVPGGSLNIAGVRLRASGILGNMNATVTSGAISFSGSNVAVVAVSQATLGTVSVVNPAALSQCAIPVTPTTLPGPATAPQLAGGFYVNVTEPAGFASAFNAANSLNPNLPNPPNPAQFWDEAGITPGGIGGSSNFSTTAAELGFQGTAQPVTRGVQITLSFTGLPTGVVLLAPQLVTGTGGAVSGGGLATSGPVTLGLVTGSGTGGSATTYAGFPSAGGVATITYEVLSTGLLSPTTVDTLSIPIYYTAPSGTLAAGSAGGVRASVGPTSGTTAFSTVATQLRFATNTGVPVSPLQTGTVNPCGGPAVGLSAASVNFGNQPVSVPSSPRPVTLTNIGLTTLTLTTLAASGDFSETDNCAGASLAPGNSCTINVTFTPTLAAARTGSVTVTDNASSSPQQLHLFGTGTSGAVPNASLSKVALDFGAVATSTSSGSQAVTLTNSGGANLTLTSIIASGDFGQTNDCGGSLASSATCTITATFSPVAIGRRDGAITIVDSASGSPHVVRLVGLGTSGTAPGIGFSSASLNFGYQASGTTSAATIVTVTNTGTATLTITAVSGSGDFGVSGAGCVTSLAPAATCTISVTFAPTTTGDRRGTVAVTDNATGSPQVIRLFGNGT